MFYFSDDKQLTVILKTGEILTWSSSHPDYQRIRELAHAENWIAVESISNFTKSVMANPTTLENGHFIINGETVEPSREDKFSQLIKIVAKKHGEDNVDAFKPFLNKVLDNTHINAVVELFDFCNNGDFLVTTDGDILAYKKVRNDMKSVHDGTTQHIIGQPVEVADYDCDRNATCSRGLHFCSESYLSCFSGDIILVLRIDPRDIVSIPVDYNYAKGRCCKYTPIGVLNTGQRLRDFNYESIGVSIVGTAEDEEDIRVRVHEMIFDDDMTVSEVAEALDMSLEDVQSYLLS